MKKILHIITLAATLLPLDALAHGTHMEIANMPQHLHIMMHLLENIIYLPFVILAIILLEGVRRHWHK